MTCATFGFHEFCPFSVVGIIDKGDRCRPERTLHCPALTEQDFIDIGEMLSAVAREMNSIGINSRWVLCRTVGQSVRLHGALSTIGYRASGPYLSGHSAVGVPGQVAFWRGQDHRHILLSYNSWIFGTVGELSFGTNYEPRPVLPAPTGNFRFEGPNSDRLAAGNGPGRIAKPRGDSGRGESTPIFKRYIPQFAIVQTVRVWI